MVIHKEVNKEIKIKKIKGQQKYYSINIHNDKNKNTTKIIVHYRRCIQEGAVESAMLIGKCPFLG